MLHDIALEVLWLKDYDGRSNYLPIYKTAEPVETIYGPKPKETCGGSRSCENQAVEAFTVEAEEAHKEDFSQSGVSTALR